MTVVGRVRECWRYPVKSMQGAVVTSIEVGPRGIVGDRAWGVYDVATGKLASAKRFGALLQASADDEAVTLPDGTRFMHGRDDANAALSHWLGREVRMVQAAAHSAFEFEMTLDPPNDDAELFAIPTPQGSLLDDGALHVVSSETLRSAAEQYPSLQWDTRRFRPNLLVETHGEPFWEDTWCGSEVHAGTARLFARQATVRCAMPLRAQPSHGGRPALTSQPQMFKALDALHANHLGLYLDVRAPGTIAAGDELRLVAAGTE